MSIRYIPEPSPIDYHADAEVRRVELAFKAIDPGDVLAVVRDQLSAQADPQADPLYSTVLFYLDRMPAVDGARLYDDCRALVLRHQPLSR
jgi:hypothetical protein